MTPVTVNHLMKRWRRQTYGYAHHAFNNGRHDVAALGYLTVGLHSSEYVDLSKLTLLMVLDERTPCEKSVIRLRGYGAFVVPHGVQWGGINNERLCKNLHLTPRRGARGQRLDLRNMKLLTVALRLQKKLVQARRFRLRAKRHLDLPRLWAQFPAGVARELQGAGPEFEQLCAKFGMAREAMFRKFERRLGESRLYPLEWVSGQLHVATGVLAELAGYPQRQLISLKRLPDALVGYQGASAYDLLISRFRTPEARPRFRRKRGHGLPGADIRSLC